MLKFQKERVPAVLHPWSATRFIRHAATYVPMEACCRATYVLEACTTPCLHILVGTYPVSDYRPCHPRTQHSTHRINPTQVQIQKLGHRYHHMLGSLRQLESHPAHLKFYHVFVEIAGVTRPSNCTVDPAEIPEQFIAPLLHQRCSNITVTSVLNRLIIAQQNWMLKIFLILLQTMLRKAHQA